MENTWEYIITKFPDHHMNRSLTGKNNIVIRIDDDKMLFDQKNANQNSKNLSHV